MKNKNVLIGVLGGLVIILLVYNIYTTNRSNNLLKNYQGQQQFQNDQIPESDLVCEKDTQPWIKVVSPNGGENFSAGQQLSIKWKSCNVDSPVGITLSGFPYPNDIQYFLGSWIDSVVGMETVLIPDNVKEGKYIINISTPPETTSGAEDYSDNTFLIHSKDGEISDTEVFTNQPGAVKSIKENGSNEWLLSVDLLSYNPKWSPGNDSAGGFFINQNPKIRNLIVTNNTQTFNCENTKPELLVNTSDFINKIKSSEYKNRYFDINGNNITAMYEQCLP